MHDNFILPVEPVGVLGARANVDLGNVPVCVSPLEVLDGCIHALTCIGPASKEMSRHYWREPLVLEALHDEEIDLCGVVFVGSPQINAEKFYVSKRVGHTVEMMDADGAFVTKERQAVVVVLDMPLLDTRQGRDLTGTLIADIVLQLLSYVAQTERENIRQRQAEGIAAAKANGVRFGRERMEMPKEFDGLMALWSEGRISARRAALQLGISHHTFLRCARERMKR